MRIIVSGGGTAGHISPILATVDALKRLASAGAAGDGPLEILYIGQAGSLEERIARSSGLEFAAIQAGKFRRVHGASLAAKVFNFETLGLNARDAARATAGLAGSFSILRRFKPDVVFVKGGFVGLPVGIAAHLMRIPLVIHESDIDPGLTNRILARWAKRVAVGFPVRGYKTLDPARLVFTGNPVRPEVLGGTRADGLREFELSDALPVLLVTGGSQGAGAINDAVLAALPQLLEFTQVIHLTGEKELPRLQFELSRRPPLVHSDRYCPRAFLTSEMAGALAVADLVVARAGANTIAELAALGKPTVLIPNYLMAGHQVANARLLSRSGAAMMLEEPGLTSERLVGEVRRILGSADEQGRLSTAIGHFVTADASRLLADVIIKAGKREVAA